MRTLVALLLLTCVPLAPFAQNYSVFGVYNTGGQNIFSAIDPDSGLVTPVAPLTGSNVYVMASSEFDEVGQRYFIRTNLGINTIDVSTGAILDTFPAPGNLSALKYDAGTNTLYGLYSLSNSQIGLARINLSTGQNNPYVLPGVSSYVANSTVFDPAGLRYIFLSTNGLEVLDLNTLSLSGPYPVQGNFSNLVYDPANNAVIGAYWKTSTQQEYLAKVDLSTGTFSDLGVMQGVAAIVAGAATLDGAQRRYITITTSGIQVFDADNASMLKTFPSTGNLSEIQFFQMERPLLSSMQTGACSSSPLTMKVLGDYDQVTWSDGYQGNSRVITGGGDFTVTGVKNGQTFTSGQRSVANMGPDQPLITWDNEKLTTQSAHSVQWFFDGVAVTFATQNTLIPFASGTYYVRATSAGGCYIDSDPMVVTLTSSAQGSETEEIEVSPNPGSELVKIRAGTVLQEIELMSLSGQSIQKIENDRVSTQMSLNVAGLSEGIYLLKIRTGVQTLTRKLVVGPK